jgi:GTP-binding protein HflX
MAKKYLEDTRMYKEKAFLVGVSIFNDKSWLSIEDSLAELELLAQTAGLDVVGEISQTLSKPNAQTFIGSGKVEEVQLLVNETKADVLIFDNELIPRHQRELEKIFGENVRVLDRTALILDIFAQHASTREGILQVELAQYEYRLPRLTRAWTHLARQAGGGGGRSGSVGGVGLRGPGETQLEVDRREIRKKITTLRSELEKVRAHRSRHRENRKRSQIPTVALVGYTNAGKSTLLNKLANSEVFVANQLFATLDPTTRRVELPEGNTALFTDTVGFIQKLPTQLVAAFRATLEEITEADILLHVVDISHPNALAQWESVNATLAEIGAEDLPIITVLNKIDKIQDQEIVQEISNAFDNAVAISALSGEGIRSLLKKIEEELYFNLIPITVLLPYNQGRLISLFHETGKIDELNNLAEGVYIDGSIPGRFFTEYEPFFQSSEPKELLETDGDDPDGTDF